ncbi:unnamed protein product [Caenorhabditis angaria]|uniref:PHD-type domain-containing protein n=1 Tax=Caenorhabditis angaria TaxID=860376 RepID=A0A9P1IE08_9PELO|nr:unnamed protein product [Caenorhabditis angaria]
MRLTLSSFAESYNLRVIITTAPFWPILFIGSMMVVGKRLRSSRENAGQSALSRENIKLKEEIKEKTSIIETRKLKDELLGKDLEIERICVKLEKERILLVNMDMDQFFRMRKTPPRKPFSTLSHQTQMLRSIEIMEMSRNVTGGEDFYTVWKFMGQNFEHENGVRWCKMSDVDTLLLMSKFNFGDGLVKAMNHYYNAKVGFSILASRRAIAKLMKLLDISDLYEFEVVTCVINKKEVQRVVIRCRSVEHLLSIRATNLANAGRLQLKNGKIIPVLSGDRGDEEAKAVIGLECSPTPNSPYSLSFICSFCGEDNYANMLKFMGRTLSTLDNIKFIDYKYGDVVLRAEVDWKKTGDFKFLSSLSAHTGQSSTNPCIGCIIPLCTHGDHRDTIGLFNFELKFDDRTEANILEHCQQGTHSMKEGATPLVQIPPKKTVPPTVHIVAGVHEKYVDDQMKAKTNKMDCALFGNARTVPHQKSMLKKKKEEELVLKSAINFLEADIAMGKNMMSAFSNYTVNPEDSCDSQYCIIDGCSSNTLDWVKCDLCQRNYHIFCMCIMSAKIVHKMKNSSSPFYCWSCREFSHEEMIYNVEFELKQYIDEAETLKTKLSSVTRDKKSMEAVLSGEGGPSRKKLDSVLKKIGCLGSAWFGNPVGNQIRKLLRPKYIEIVLEVFPDDEFKSNLRKVMILLGEIMTASGKQTFNDFEKLEFKDTISRFVNALREFCPEENVIPKLHYLVKHVPEYIDIYDTWGGACSEQSTEHFHVVYRKVKKAFSSIKDLIFQAKLMVRRFGFLNYLNDIGENCNDPMIEIPDEYRS